MRALYSLSEKRETNDLVYLKFLIVYIFGVFILNVVSIFYLDRANNSINDQIEFWITLIAPTFVALPLVFKNPRISRKQIIWALIFLLIGCPTIFFIHVALWL